MSIRGLLSYIFPSLAPAETTPVTLHGPNPNRFPLGDEYSHICTLPDGRKFGYAEYGSPTGKPVFFFHGLPGSRIEGCYFHEIGLKHGARIISPDRPGLGLSSPQPDRKLLDFPKDIENLAKHLGLKEYAIMGASGAGPSVLACAYALPPSQLKCASLICCLGPSDIIGHKGGYFHFRVAFPYGWRIAPNWLLGWSFKYVLNGPIGRVDLPDEERVRRMLAPSVLAKAHPKEREILKDEDFWWASMKVANEGYGKTFDWEAQDGKISCRPWGFKIEDIRHDLPVHLWYGKLDMNVPIDHGNQIAAKLGGRAEYHVVDETHTSIFFNYKEEALKEVLKTF